MPVIWPRQFGDIGGTITKAAGDVGKGVTGAAGGVTDAADGVKKAADTAKEAGEMVDKAKEAYATYEEVQKKITYYYDLYLQYKWLIQLVAIIIVIMIIMCWLQCAWQYFKCCSKVCCCPVFFGLWLRDKGCCRGVAACCIRTKRCVPDLETMEDDAARANKVEVNGCDSTWLLRRCGRDPIPEEQEAINKLRWTYQVSRAVPCVPTYWKDASISDNHRSNYLDKKGHIVVEQGKQTLANAVAASAERAKRYGIEATGRVRRSEALAQGKQYYERFGGRARVSVKSHARKTVKVSDSERRRKKDGTTYLVRERKKSSDSQDEKHGW